MQCEMCGVTFDPPREVAHLIEKGQIPRVCDACARPEPSIFTRVTKRTSTRRDTHSILQRVDVFDPDGIVRQWMSLMPERPLPHGARPVKRGRLHVFVMSERSHRVRPLSRVSLRTNLTTFQREGAAFRAWKIPDRADDFTGIGNVELAHSNFDALQDDGGLEVNVRGKDGTRIRLLFKN